MSALKSNFQHHCEKCDSSIQRANIDSSELRGVINTVEKKFITEIKFLEGKHRTLEFEMDQKVRVDHLR